MSSADTFANSLDPDQARQKGRARSGSKLPDTLLVFLNQYFEKMILKKKSADDKIHAGKELRLNFRFVLQEENISLRQRSGSSTFGVKLYQYPYRWNCKQ